MKRRGGKREGARRKKSPALTKITREINQKHWRANHRYIYLENRIFLNLAEGSCGWNLSNGSTCAVYSYFNERCRIKIKLSDKTAMFCGIIFMNNFIKIIPARAGHCTANYNLLFSPGMTDFDEFIHKNPT